MWRPQTSEMESASELLKRFVGQVKLPEGVQVDIGDNGARILGSEVDCWLWLEQCQSCHSSGYHFIMNGKYQLPHRAAWVLFKGDIPAGKCSGTSPIYRQCRVKNCVNPGHLSLGPTVQKNSTLGHRSDPDPLKQSKMLAKTVGIECPPLISWERPWFIEPL